MASNIDMRIKRIHHLTLAVRDAEGARLTFEQLFDVVAVATAVSVPAFGIRATAVPLGDSVLQLAAPVAADNPVMRFLERKGEGLYNVALEVDDLDAAVAELTSQGVRVSQPVEAQPGLRSAFITMAATHGLSIELVELSGAAEEASETPAEPVSTEPAPAAAVAVEEEPEAPSKPDEWSDREEAGQPKLLDLTPDEWSDVD